MTVSSTLNREQYATNGVTTAFAIHFPFFNDTDVNAIFVDALGNVTTLALNADFTVSGGGGAGGSLVANAAPAAGGTLTLYRQIPFTQEDDYVEDDPLPADTLEGGFDRAVMRDQQLKDSQDRALTFPVTIAPGVSAVLPNPQADAVLGWNSAADGLENKTLEPGTTVYASIPNTNAGATTNEAVTPAGLAGSKFNPTGKHMIPIMAGAMRPAITSGAVAGVTEIAGTGLNYATMNFADGATSLAFFAIVMPKSWDGGTITWRPILTATGATGNVLFNMHAVCLAAGDNMNVALGSATASLAVIGTADKEIYGPLSGALTMSGTPAGDNTAYFRIFRLGTDASDTLAATARLIGIELFITTNAGNDA